MEKVGKYLFLNSILLVTANVTASPSEDMEWTVFFNI